MAECIARFAGKKDYMIFSNAIDAMNAISGGIMPKMIFLDIMLDGPDGFSFLNEMISYDDTSKIPIIIVSSLDFSKVNLGTYNVVGVLNKDTMMPLDIKKYISEYYEK